MKSVLNIRIITFTIATALFLLNCLSPKQAYTNKENLYKKNNQELNARFIAYHLNDSVSTIYFDLPNENLIYKRPDTTTAFYAACKIKYFLHNMNSNQLLDSGSVLIFDRQGETVFSKNIFGRMYSKTKSGDQYIADVFIYDLNKKSKSAYVLNIDKTNRFSRQNFLVKNEYKEVLFDPYIKAGDVIFIESQTNTASSFAVDYFYREYPLAPPPFSLVERSAFNYKPDSTFTISANNSVFKIQMPSRGFYHIIAEPESKTGLTLFAVEASFPGLKSETEMIKSTRFIMSKKEFDACLSSQNKKQAIDKFWLDIAGSNERAKELIRKYYGRVSEANRLFTSHQTGWQTDRGMIYVVFGSPSNMQKNKDGETWVYGNEADVNILRFNFRKVINPFSDNDYVLERHELYKEAWYNSVDGWRQGHIYLDN